MMEGTFEARRKQRDNMRLAEELMGGGGHGCLRELMFETGIKYSSWTGRLQAAKWHMDFRILTISKRCKHWRLLE